MSTTFAWTLDSFSPDPHFLPSVEQEADNYREMAETLAEAGCDLLVMEMMGDVDRARRVTEAAIATGLPVWVGFTCTLDSFSAEPGEVRSPPFQAVIDGLLDLDVQVAGIMHTSVADTTPGLEMLYQSWPGPVMAYPETALFDPVDKSAPPSIAPAEFAEHCRGWVENGVQIIGGCCGTTIEHIRAMVDQLPSRPGRRAAH